MISWKPTRKQLRAVTLPVVMLSGMMLLTSCETGSSSAVTPTLYEYTSAFQAQAAEELDALPPACRRNVSDTSSCSPLATLVQDYGVVRAEIRAIRE